MSPLVECVGVGKRFGGVVALRDVDLAIARGEVLGVIGPNGAGKSTLIGILNGFLRPTEGRVLLSGEDVTARQPWRLARAGMRRTFQAATAFPSLTLEQNVRAGAAVASRAEDRGAWVASLLAWLGLSPRARPDALTAGQLRLLAVSRAAAGAPLVLFLDEPAAGLSRYEAEEMTALLRRIREELDTTLVIVEHNMDFIFANCSRIVTLDYGSLIADGTPAEIRNDQRVIDAYLGRRVEAVG